MPGAQESLRVVVRIRQGAQEGEIITYIARAFSGATEAKGSTAPAMNVRTLKVKEWRYSTSVHTSGFIVDRCSIVYTHVDPATFLALADEFANAQTGDYVDVYVTIDGVETEIFQGVVKEWRWEESPDGVQLATLETEDRRARLLDTYVPQGTFARGVITDPITGAKTANATFLQVMQLLGALSGVDIDITTFNPPDYAIGPSLSFSGRTPVGTAMARLLKVYQYTLLGRVDLIRTGVNLYAIKQRPMPPYPDGIVIPAAATRLRKFHRTYVPRILRSIVNGYGQKGKSGGAKCSKNLLLDGVSACTLPGEIIDLSPVTERVPYVHYDSAQRKVAEGEKVTTTWQGRLLSETDTFTKYLYKADGTFVRAIKYTSVHIPDYDGVGLCLRDTTTLSNEQDGVCQITTKFYHYRNVVLELAQGSKGYLGEFKTAAKPDLTTETVESIYDTTQAITTEGDPRYGLPALASSSPKLRTVHYSVESKKATDSGAVLKQYSQFLIGGDGFTMVPAGIYHDIAPGNGVMTKKPGPPLQAASPNGVLSLSAADTQSVSIQDDMIGLDGDAERIADLAITQGGQWHIEVSIEMPIDVNIHPHDFITLTDGFVIPGLRTFMVVSVEVQDSGTGYMIVQGETWAPAPATDWGGILDPRGGIPAFGSIGAYSGKVTPTQGAIQFLHGTIMSANADGTYEVFCQEEGHVYPSVQVYGQLSDYPLQPREQVVLERAGMVLYIVN